MRNIPCEALKLFTSYTELFFFVFFTSLPRRRRGVGIDRQAGATIDFGFLQEGHKFPFLSERKEPTGTWEVSFAEVILPLDEARAEVSFFFFFFA